MTKTGFQFSGIWRRALTASTALSQRGKARMQPAIAEMTRFLLEVVEFVGDVLTVRKDCRSRA
jgi:hypothetical protein